jgi:hypothetical protein
MTLERKSKPTSVIVLILMEALDDANHRTVAQYRLAQDSAVTEQFFIKLINCGYATFLLRSLVAEGVQTYTACQRALEGEVLRN